MLDTTSKHSDKVIEVNANSDVSVHGFNYAPYSPDAFLVTPVNNIGVS